MKPARLRHSPQTLQVLDFFLSNPKGWKHGYDINQSTGLMSGTLYPILMRMAERGLLETCWETPEGGRPPRHLYRFTPEGLRYARELKAARSGSGARNPLLNPRKS